MGQHHGTPWLPGGSSVYERKLHGNIHLKSLPQPWEWRDWMAHLDGELNMPNRSCVKADDTHVVPDVALRKSGEFPKLDMRLAKELVKNAEAGCQALYIRIKAVRELLRSQRKLRYHVPVDGLCRGHHHAWEARRIHDDLRHDACPRD